MKKYDEIRKTATGQRDDYTTWCFLDYAYFKKNCQLITADLSKQKAFQQIVFTSTMKTKWMMQCILENIEN